MSSSTGACSSIPAAHMARDVPLQIHLPAQVEHEDAAAIEVQEGGQRNFPPLSWCGAACVTAMKAGGQLASIGSGKGLGLGVALAFVAMPLSWSIPLGFTLVTAGGGAAGYYAGIQVAEGTGGGMGLRTLLTLGPVVVPLARALILQSSPTLQAASLGWSVGSLVANAHRDSWNAVGRDALPDAVPIDEHGNPLPAKQALAEHGLYRAAVPIVPNIGVAATGQFFLAAALERVTGSKELAAAISDSLVRAGWVLPLEGGRYAAGPMGLVPGKGLRAVRDNLQDWKHIKATAAHAARHTSMRIALASLTTDLMRLVAGLLPEGSSEQFAVEIALCIAQALGEMRGDAVARYEAAQADATALQPAHSLGARTMTVRV